MKEWKLRISVLALAASLWSAAGAQEAADGTTQTDSVEYSVSPVLLQEITVKADRFIRTSNGLTVIPDSNQRRHAFSGYDLLRNLMIPGVSVDAVKGSVTALGGSVKLYIDGMPADEREVRQLRPQDVERVVFMEAPTGRYAGDATALDFILRKRDSGGYVAADAQQRIGYGAGDYNLAAKFFRRSTQYTLFAGSDYRELKGSGIERSDAILFPDSPVGRRYTTLYSVSRKNSQYGQLRVRNKTERRTLRATLNVVRDAMPVDRNVSELAYDGLPSGALSSVADRTERSRSMKYGLGLSGTFKLPDAQSIDASASASVTHTSYDYTYLESSSSVRSCSSEDFYNIAANAGYVRKFSRGNTLTAKVTELFNVSSAYYDGSFGSWEHLWMSESLAFVEYMHPLGRIGSIRVSPGVSAQFYRLHGHDLVKNFAPRMQLVITLQPGRGQHVQIGGAYGNSYPQLSMITGATTQVDPLMLRRGNPDLGQSKIWQSLAVYGFSAGPVSLQALVLFNGAADMPLTEYGFEDGMLVQSFRGDGRWIHFNPGLSATWTPSMSLGVRMSGGWQYDAYRGGAHLTATAFVADVGINWYVGDFSLGAFATSPRKEAGYDLTVRRGVWDYGISAGWSRGNLRLEACAHNPFYRRPRIIASFATVQYTGNSSTFSPVDRQSLYIKAAYSFDFGKKTSRDKSNVDRSVSSGILRAR